MRARLAALALLSALVLSPAPAGASALPAPVPCPGCWQPAPVTSWQWQLQGRVDLSLAVDMVDVDLFDTPAATVAALHARGRKVVCYLDAGSWERWRPDAARFPAAVKGKPLEGWPGERWLDVRRRAALAPVLRARLDLCKAKGFDGVEFDNVDGYQNPTGFPLSASDQLAFNVWLANEARRRGLSPGLKNDLDQVLQLLPYFGWALDEECFAYDECDLLAPFVRAGKAVFEVEYSLAPAVFCPRANALGFNALRKKPELGAWRVACR